MEKRIKLAFFADDLNYNRFIGPLVYLENIIKELTKLKKELTVYIITFDKKINFLPQKNQIVLPKPRFYLPWSFYTCKKILKKYKFDIIQYNRISPRQIFCSPKFPKKILFFHGDAPLVVPHLVDFKTRILFNFVYKRFIKFFDYFICPSISLKKNLVKFFNNENKCNVIYEGARKFKCNKIKNEKIKKLKPYILHISNLDPQRNPLVVLEIFKNLNIKNLKLIIIGKGWRDFYNKKKFKIKNIIIKGQIDNKNLSCYYRNAELLLHPTIHETFGLTLAEAIVYNTPIVSTKVFSVPEVVKNAGILIDDPYDVKKFKEAVEKILKNKNFRKKLKSNAKKLEKKYLWEKVARKTLAFYKKILI